MSELSKTPLCQWHSAHGGRMVDFAGWWMPVQYTSIVSEHQATRTAAGLFDISHMGRLAFVGRGAAEFLDRVLTRRASNLRPGQIRYALMTREDGGILDDVLVYHLAPPQDGAQWALVVNAGNRAKIVRWLEEQGGRAAEVGMQDRTAESAMIAVQGPAAWNILRGLLDGLAGQLKYYSGASATICGQPCLLSRTGYTGEDGAELVLAADAAATVWQALLEQGRGEGLQPAGLGARDTLRLEAALPLYGHELTEAIHPFQAGLAFAVDLDHAFIGREALSVAQQRPDWPRRVGLEMAGRRIPREHFLVLRQGEPVGEVTSGTFSPTLERPIAMAYVRPEAAEVGTALEVDIRGRGEPARVVSLPFYRRPA